MIAIKNKKIFAFLYCLVFFLPFCCHALSNSVLVSVAPHKFFVEKIAGHTIETRLMVPAGSSSHTYEPTHKQMIAASQADIWFSIGEPFEKKSIQAIQSHQPHFLVVDLRKGLNLIKGPQCCNHAHDDSSADLHFWLSPQQAKIQAKTIAQALMDTYPTNKELYQKNLNAFLAELEQLDQKIVEILAPLQNRTILVSHPAYAYFARDYGLEQLSIEWEGKDPTPQQMTKILNTARNKKIHTIFIQRQYNNKGARLIADEIGAKVVILDPYSEDYYNTLLEIAHAFAGV
jgi:zinc transport system substrate-binding protein